MRFSLLFGFVCAWHASGCLFYDSRIGQAETTQRKAAAQMAPASLERSGAARLKRPEARSSLRSVRLRAYATPAYRSSTLNWEKDFRQTVGQANAVLRSALNVELTVESLRGWDSEPNLRALGQTLRAAEAMDPGEGVDVVAVLVAPIGTLSLSFDELGLARGYGKHLVLRHSNEAAELEAVEVRYRDLPDQERAGIYHTHRRHKRTSVLLHEFAHLLGAMHVSAERSLMHPTYNRHMEAFAPETLALLRVALEEGAPGLGLPATLAQFHLRVFDEQKGAGWFAAEVTTRRRLLEQVGKPQPGRLGMELSTESAAAVSTTDERLKRVLALRTAGAFQRAWEEAQPLFSEHPESRPIQELRCQLAMQLGFPWARLQGECEAFKALSR